MTDWVQDTVRVWVCLSDLCSGSRWCCCVCSDCYNQGLKQSAWKEDCCAQYLSLWPLEGLPRVLNSAGTALNALFRHRGCHSVVLGRKVTFCPIMALRRATEVIEALTCLTCWLMEVVQCGVYCLLILSCYYWVILFSFGFGHWQPLLGCLDLDRLFYVFYVCA